MKLAGLLSARYFSAIALLTGLAAAPVAVSAKVADVSERGFVIRHFAEIPEPAETVWATLLKPADWWDAAHTWSGSSANLSLDARAGGCFCEVLPNTSSPKAAPRGSVEHMRVIYIESPRALRMTGALGPLQSDAATGTLTVQLKSSDDGKRTQLLLEYVVGGYIRKPYPEMAQAVDGMLGQQVGRLAEKLGGEFAAAFGAPEQGVPPQEDASSLPGVIPLSEVPLQSGAKAPVGR